MIYNKHNLSKWLYKKVIPFLNSRTLLSADIFKTNQIEGSNYAVYLKKIFKKKLIVRCGRMPSMFAQKRASSLRQLAKIKNMEKYAFRNADAIVVPTEFMKDYVETNYDISPDKINIIPNYVDVNLFKPNENIRKVRNRICTIGKNHLQKNFEALIEASRGMKDITLVIIGEACYNETLRSKAIQCGVHAEFLGSMPNSKLPEELNKSELFVLPSLYEGHPKALLEAMACGLPLIGTDVKGINNIIKHKENGYLCKVSPESIENAILDVMNNDELKQHMGRNARKYVVHTCSLDKVLQMEMELYGKLLA